MASCISVSITCELFKRGSIANSRHDYVFSNSIMPMEIDFLIFKMVLKSAFLNVWNDWLNSLFVELIDGQHIFTYFS